MRHEDWQYLGYCPGIAVGQKEVGCPLFSQVKGDVGGNRRKPVAQFEKIKAPKGIQDLT
jgi:hypothetical protein